MERALSVYQTEPSVGRKTCVKVQVSDCLGRITVQESSWLIQASGVFTVKVGEEVFGIGICRMPVLLRMIV